MSNKCILMRMQSLQPLSAQS
ncbi:hypothetical protein BC2230_10416 [Burkholderia cepacia]